MKQSQAKWIILGCTCFLMFGNYYAYDIPAATNKQLKEYLQMSDEEYDRTLNLFYSVYSMPNIVLPFFIGAIMDLFGIGRVVVLMSSLVCIGQVLFTLGITYRVVWLALLGRTLFGLGGESLGVGQTTFAAIWFGPSTDKDNSGRDDDIPLNNLSRSVSGREQSEATLLASDGADIVDLQESNYDNDASTSIQEKTGLMAMAMGLNLSIGRFGSVVNDLVSPVIAVRAFSNPSNSKDDNGIPLNVARGVPACLWIGVLTCFLSFLAVLLLVYIDFHYRLHPRYLELQENNSVNPSNSLPETKQHSVASLAQLINALRRVPFCFWVICLVMILSYGTVIPFNTIHSAFLQDRFGMDPVVAAGIMAIPDTISMFLTPFTGIFVDKFGYRLHVLLVCMIALGTVHVTLGFLQGSALIPIMPLLILGICYSLLLLFWPIFAMIVPREILSSSMGISSCVLNFALTLFPNIVAALITFDRSYRVLELFFVGCAFSGSICCLLAMHLDKTRHGSILKKKLAVT
jgi:nitrate/nitrite transporter NarK